MVGGNWSAIVHLDHYLAHVPLKKYFCYVSGKMESFSASEQKYFNVNPFEIAFGFYGFIFGLLVCHNRGN